MITRSSASCPTCGILSEQEVRLVPKKYHTEVNRILCLNGHVFVETILRLNLTLSKSRSTVSLLYDNMEVTPFIRVHGESL